MKNKKEYIVKITIPSSGWFSSEYEFFEIFLSKNYLDVYVDFMRRNHPTAKIEINDAKGNL